MTTGVDLLPGSLLAAVLAIVAGWLAVGAAGVAALHRLRLVSRVLFPLGSVLGVALAAVALAALFAPAETLVLPIGLPTLPLRVRAQQQHGAHDLVGQRVAHPGGVAQQQVALQRLHVARRDAGGIAYEGSGRSRAPALPGDEPSCFAPTAPARATP